jgi:hypothetical protein
MNHKSVHCFSRPAQGLLQDVCMVWTLSVQAINGGGRRTEGSMFSSAGQINLIVFGAQNRIGMFLFLRPVVRGLGALAPNYKPGRQLQRYRRNLALKQE